jgi:hypothetical protein
MGSVMTLTSAQHKALAAEIRDCDNRRQELLSALLYLIGENPTFATSWQQGLDRCKEIAEKNRTRVSPAVALRSIG